MRHGASDREQQVLDALIKLYIERREPVSSRMIEESGRLSIKSASIRSVMHELEKRGLLTQPHSSAGRLPTDEGYRVYVDGLISDLDLDRDQAAEVEHALHEAGEDLHEILHATVRVLGRFSQNIAILAGPREFASRIVGVDLYQRDTNNVLVAIQLESGATRTELVDTGREVRAETLLAANSFLAERLMGRTLDDTRRDLQDLLQTDSGDPEKDMAHNLALSGRSLFDPEGTLHLTFEGVSEALDQPEFGDPARLKALLELISSAERFELALDQFAGQTRGEVALAIGQENALPSLHPFSLLATRFELGEKYGYLALLGPRRMRYARSLAVIRLIARHLDRLSV